MLNIKRRNLPQLLNYKKYLSDKTKKIEQEIQKYLLAVRNCDKTKEIASMLESIIKRFPFKKRYKR